MESIVKKLFLSGCLVVGIAASLTAFSSTHAADETAKGETSFKLTVLKALTLSNVTSDTITAKPGSIATGSLNATVQSGSKYTLSLSAAQPNLVKDANNNIPAKSNLAGLTTTDNGWGVNKQGSSNDYDAVTTSPTVFFTSASAADTEVTTKLPIGVRTTSTLPAGNYSTTVTVTAATTN